MTAKFSNISEVPLALAVFLASDNYDYNNDPFTISATTLLKPVRQVILPTRVPPGEGLINLADMLNLRMGSAIHDGIERAWKDNAGKALAALGYPQRVIDRIQVNPTQEVLQQSPDLIPVYLEQRHSKQIGQWTITGKFDFVGEGRVQDFKTTTTYAYKKQVNAQKYTQQGSIYRWLAPQLITEDEMDIHYIFTDWKPTLAKSDSSYPPKRFHKQSFPLLSINETEAFIRRKLDAIAKYWDMPEEDISQCDDEDLWRSEPVYKYYKNPQKTARATKNFDTMQDAIIRLHEDGNVGMVKEVPGQVTACKYCAAFPVCSQKDQLIASGDLIL
jgi:hypothetical protein